MTTYAVADKVPEGCDYLTAGKEYEVITDDDDGIGFEFQCDDGDFTYGLWQNCAFLNGGNWRRVEK